MLNAGRVVLLLSLLAWPTAVYAQRPSLRAGAAKAEITPELGVSLDGPIAKNGLVKAVHDPLHARAVVLDDGHTRIALVICDLTMIGRDVVDEAKAIVERTSGLPAKNILVAATHTHASPRANHIVRGPKDDAYHKLLSARIAEAIFAAEKNLLPAAVGSGSFDEKKYLRCRRSLCEPGTVPANPFGVTDEQVRSVSQTDGEVLRPAGPIDPQFSVLSIRHADGAPLAALGNYSVHYAGGYRAYTVSADYFGQFAAAIESEMKPGNGRPPFLGLMSNGTSGNTGSIAGGGANPPFEHMKIIGRDLADKAMKTIAAIEHRSDAALGVATKELEFAVRKPDAARLAWADKALADPKAKHPHKWTPVYAQEARELDQYPATIRIQLQAVKIGDTLIAAIPCEPFAETGLAIKAHDPQKRTFTISLANGYGGYLPPPEQHRLGGYETWPGRGSFLEVDAEPKIRATTIELLMQLATDDLLRQLK